MRQSRVFDIGNSVVSENIAEVKPPEFYRCESCGRSVPAEKAFAPMETLDVFCADCLLKRLKPCEECGSLILAPAYQHLPTSRVLFEPCALKTTSS